jgi:transcriptional regulator with XRE-family HTH domain
MKLSTPSIVEALLRHTGWSERKLAEWLGVAANTLSNWLAGGAPRADNLAKASRRLRLTDGQFLGREPLPKDWLGRIDFEQKIAEEAAVSVSLDELRGLLNAIAELDAEHSRSKERMLAQFIANVSASASRSSKKVS